MAPKIPDIYLHLTLGKRNHPLYPSQLTPPTGLITFLSIHHISSSLRTLLTLTTTTTARPPRTSHAVTQESAIKTSSLTILATCANTEISAAATRILVERVAAHDGARRAVERDLRCGVPRTRRRAWRAVRMVRGFGGAGRWGERAGRGERGVLWEAGLERGAREVEERDARRRRREAVVVHDGVGRIGEGDVWMREREV